MSLSHDVMFNIYDGRKDRRCELELAQLHLLYEEIPPKDLIVILSNENIKTKQVPTVCNNEHVWVLCGSVCPIGCTLASTLQIII